jgi:hypothetical protein
LPNTEQLLLKKRKLKQKYLLLIEDAYNFKQTDQAFSDLLEFQAIKTLNKINQLKFVVTDSAESL